MKKLGIFLIALVITVGAAVAVHAQNRRGHHLEGFFGHLRQLKQELHLSAAQTEQIHAIVREARAANAQYREQMHGGYIAIAQTLIANPNDTAAAQTMLDRQTANERALKANLLAATSKALNVLTPEQRTKLATLLADRAERHARHRR